MIRFIIFFLLAAITLWVSALLAVHENLTDLPDYQTLILILFTTTVIFLYLYKAKNAFYFVQLYLFTMIVKILAYGVYVYFMITADPADAVKNVVFFLVCYLVFTILEISFLYRKISTTHSSHTPSKKN